jgi:ferredoxin-fold anticodon binding domain-containing protein
VQISDVQISDVNECADMKILNVQVSNMQISDVQISDVNECASVQMQERQFIYFHILGYSKQENICTSEICISAHLPPSAHLKSAYLHIQKSLSLPPS